MPGSGYFYDAAGNMTSDGLNNYAFDAENERRSTSPVPGMPGTAATFAYDPNGLCVNNNGTYYIYDGAMPIAEYANGASATSPSVEYVYAGADLVASIAATTVTYLYGDHLSTRVQADTTGKPTRTFGHYPFGETWYETGTPSKWKFTTYERDSSSGLDYVQARFASTSLGRFMSTDPLSGDIGNPQSLNRFAYVVNDPINLSDPTGADPPGCVTGPTGCVPSGGNNWTCLLDNYGNCVGGNGLTGGCLVDGFSVDCGLANVALQFGGFAMLCDPFSGCSSPNPNFMKWTDEGWQFRTGGFPVWATPDPNGKVSFWTMSCPPNFSETNPCDMHLYAFYPQIPKPSLIARYQNIPEAKDFSWWGTFFRSYYDGSSARQSLVDAWNKGYYSCIVKGSVGAAATKAGERLGERG